jgi:hypothetical protein
MRVTTARETSLVPFCQVQLILALGEGYTYTGWFIAFDLVPYDLILGKDFMEEVEHHINHHQNALDLEWDETTKCWRHKLQDLERGFTSAETHISMLSSSTRGPPAAPTVANVNMPNMPSVPKVPTPMVPASMREPPATPTLPGNVNMPNVPSIPKLPTPIVPASTRVPAATPTLPSVHVTDVPDVPEVPSLSKGPKKRMRKGKSGGVRHRKRDTSLRVVEATLVVIEWNGDGDKKADEVDGKLHNMDEYIRKEFANLSKSQLASHHVDRA